MGVPPGQEAAARVLARLSGAERPVETHISAVFVGPERALKLKKAVNLGFLDFADPAQRRRLTEREFALNAPAAPGLYRAVHGIAGDRLVAPDDPAAAEWAIEMAPVSPGDFLDAVAARGGLDGAMLDALADAVVALQAGCPAVAVREEPRRFASVLRGNARSALSAGLPAERVLAWRRGSERWRRRLSPALSARAAAGLVRRCHGDLHLGNLLLWQGRPTPFDALEFDEELAIVDLGYDLAFLLADLLRRSGREAACRTMNRSLARTGDVGMLAPLPLWLSARAMIRAHVLARAPGGAGALEFLADAEAHLGPPRPRLVAVGGLPGTGKTHLARRLAPVLGAAPGALHLRSDEIRKRLAGVSPETRLGAGHYTAGCSMRVHAELLDHAARALAAGHAVVADATFMDPALRGAVEAVAREAGAPFLGLWLEARAELLRARVAARRGDASDATVAVLEATLRAGVGALAWARLDAEGDALPAALALAESC